MISRISIHCQAALRDFKLIHGLQALVLFSIQYAHTKSAAYLERDSVDADIEIHEIPCVFSYEKETKYTIYG